MARYNDAKYLRKDYDLSKYDVEYSPSDTIKYSGIYKCVNCGKEVACNKRDPFPPQNDIQHPCQKKIRWKLIVATD